MSEKREAKRGIPSRLLRGMVAFSVALVAGAMASSWLGWVGGVSVGLVGWLGAALFLRWLRGRPRLRRVLGTVLLAWFVVAVLRGLDRCHLQAYAPLDRSTAHGLDAEAGAFEVGFAARDFALPEDATLAGWGMAPRRLHVPAFGGFGLVGKAAMNLMGPPSDGEAPWTPLFARPNQPGTPVGARALVLRPRDSRSPTFGFVRLDLIYVDASLRGQLLAYAQGLGFAAGSLVVSASHTHSGPGGTMRARAAQALGTDHHDERIVRVVLKAAQEALREAMGNLRAAHVAAIHARDVGDDGLPFLVQTRGKHADRDPLGDRERIDNRILALHFVDAETGDPLAVLVNYAVQPVMLRPRHLEFGPDIVGAIEQELQDALPGRPPVLFLNGHCGDVTPRRGDLAGADGAHELAREFARRLAPSFDEQMQGTERRIDAPPARHARVRIRGVWNSRWLGPRHAFVTLGSRRAFEDDVLSGPLGDGTLSTVASVLCLPVNAWIWSLGLADARVGFTFRGAAGMSIRMGSAFDAREELASNWPARAGVITIDTAEGTRLATFLCHGGVGTQALARQWRGRAEAMGIPPPFLVGMADGALGYLVTEDEFEAGRYEAVSSLHGRRGSTLVEEMLFSALVDAAE